MPDELNLSQRLAELGREFNTNEKFGFEGIIGKNLDPQSPEARALSYPQAAPAPAAAPSIDQALQAAPQITPPPPAPAPVVPDPAQILDPINTALQSYKTQTTNELRNLSAQINDLRSIRSQVPATAPDGTPDPTGDKLASQISALEQSYKNLHRVSAHDRARSAMQAVSQKYPQAGLNDVDFDEVWTGNGLEQDPSLADRVDWVKHFDMVARSKAEPKLRESMRVAEERARSLEVELQQLKSNRPNPIDEMGSAPRANRSPSVGGLQQNNLFGAGGVPEEDAIYDRAVDLMGGQNRSKGRFMGFNRALNESQRQLRLQGQI